MGDRTTYQCSVARRHCHPSKNAHHRLTFKLGRTGQEMASAEPLVGSLRGLPGVDLSSSDTSLVQTPGHEYNLWRLITIPLLVLAVIFLGWFVLSCTT